MVFIALSEKEKERRKEQIRLDRWSKQHKMINNTDYKRCNRCKEWLPATTEYFYKNKANGIDGLFPYCKKCNINKSLVWRDENLDKCRYYDRKRSQKSHRKIKVRAYNEKYREQGGYLLWQRKNKDKIKEYNTYREMHKQHDITEGEWNNCKNYFNYECVYCGIAEDEAEKIYNNKLHKDHVIYDGANDLSNCVPACKSCNSKKHTFELEEWYKSDENFTQKRLEKIQRWLNQDYTYYIEKI